MAELKQIKLRNKVKYNTHYYVHFLFMYSFTVLNEKRVKRAVTFIFMFNNGIRCF